jgi:hypothetical protein
MCVLPLHRDAVVRDLVAQVQVDRAIPFQTLLHIRLYRGRGCQGVDGASFPPDRAPSKAFGSSGTTD